MIRNEKKIEGYWYSKDEPQYPKPKANDRAWKGKKEFLEKLNKVEKKAGRTLYRVFSICRICRKPWLYGVSYKRMDLDRWVQALYQRA